MLGFVYWIISICIDKNVSCNWLGIFPHCFMLNSFFFSFFCFFVSFFHSRYEVYVIWNSLIEYISHQHIYIMHSATMFNLWFWVFLYYTLLIALFYYSFKLLFFLGIIVVLLNLSSSKQKKNTKSTKSHLI